MKNRSQEEEKSSKSQENKLLDLSIEKAHESIKLFHAAVKSEVAHTVEGNLDEKGKATI